ncbi:hypothetical protein UCRPC4_g04527 [Phaeomoniella chlamydospora]|uniref:Dynactin subunit n=1 Tax=Phaeomoniella chlamydospora TaxID=158046 RepID=A0A0G2E8R8_PHACM|nr:hypothetical protein UCRPC4_g04527 [Phaeomoniella chlamydospora]
MAVNKKYADLPDLDLAPDIYQTPELVDDASTAKVSSPLDEARTRFEPSYVDARDVDFSDRVGLAHKSYRTSSRIRRRRSKGGTEELGDISDEEQETDQVRLARLRREAEELKQQIEEADGGESQVGESQANVDMRDGVAALNLLLDNIRMSPKGPQSAEETFLRSLSGKPELQDHNVPSMQTNGAPATGAQKASPFAPAAALSDRLANLEASLGLTVTSATSATTAVLPALSSLTSQITTLTNTLTPASESLSGSPNVHLDELSTRIRTLVNESERLTAARKAAAAAAVELANARASAAAIGSSHSDQMTAQHKVATATNTANANLSLSILDDQTSKIRSLYQVLPTITSLHPILPTVLERLRSLSAIHAGASEAATDLEEVEKGQAALDQEIIKWREGLEKLESKIKDAEQVTKGNVEVIGERLRKVEERMKHLK